MSPTDQPPVLARLLASNSQWSSDVTSSLPTFFTTSAKGQSPKVLWIGCADSRVPESVVLACPPGDIFVHRNIANQFSLDDDSALSVLQYAVDHVGVEHVIVAGHTGCGGAAACFAAANGNPVSGIAPQSPLGIWLEPLSTMARDLVASGACHDPVVGMQLLIENNVKVQVDAVCECDTITNAWAAGNKVQIHGWVYTLDTGLITDLGVTRGAPQ